MDDKLREALATGRELYRKKEFSRAEPYLSQLAAANVPYADVYNMLGVIHHDSGHFTKAQSCFEQALKINPAYTEAGLNLAVVYNDMGKYVDAKDTYVSTMTSSTDSGGKLDNFTTGKLANMYAEIAEVYTTAGSFDEGIAEYRRALALRPTFIDLRLKLAQALRESNDHEGALKELKLILGQNPEYLPARITMGITQFSVGNAPGAIDTLKAVLVDHPGEKRAKLYLDMIESHQQRSSDQGS